MSSRSRPRPSLAVAALALLGFIAIGLPEGALGVAWPSIQETFDQPLSALGLLLAVTTAGYLTASLVSGHVAARLGAGRSLTLAAALGAVGFTGYVVTPTWAGLVLASVFTGLCGGVLDAAINSYVAVQGGVRSLNLLHACFGVGAALAPLLVTAIVANGGSWRVAYVVLVGVELVLLVGFAATRHEWDVAPAEADPDRPAGPLGAAAPFRPLLTLSVTAFFVYVAVEATAGQWAYSLLTEERGMDVTAAGLWVGAYWGSLTVGRAIAGVVGHRVDPLRLLDGSIVALVVATGLVWWSPTPVLGALGLVGTGLAAAAVFPTLVAVTPARLGAHRAARVIGYQVAAAAAGGAVVPAITGVLAEEFSLEVVGPVLVACSLLLLFTHRATVRVASTTTTAALDT